MNKYKIIPLTRTPNQMDTANIKIMEDKNGIRIEMEYKMG